MAEQYGAKLGGEKGNLTLSSYDGTYQVKVAIGDECLVEWTEGGNDNVCALINDAFDVGKEGKLRVDRILSLRRLAIDEPRWKRAMEAISDAIRVESSKSYVRFYQRPSPDKPFVQLSLDIAKL